MANQFDRSNHTERVLLVSDFFHAELLDLVDLFELAFAGPLEIVLATILVKRLKHWQLANAFLGSLHLQWDGLLGRGAATNHSFEFFLGR